MSTGNYHPDVRLRTLQAHLHLDWDGAISVTTPGQIIGVDGRMLHPHAHTHRISPHDPLWVQAAQVVAAAVQAHHDALGLCLPPATERPIHLHPQQHPGLPQGLGQAVPAMPLSDEDKDRLRRYIVTTKEEELNASATHGSPIIFPLASHPLTPARPDNAAPAADAPPSDIALDIVPLRPLLGLFRQEV